MTERPTIKLIDNPVAVGETHAPIPAAHDQDASRTSRKPASRRRAATPSRAREQHEAPSDTNPYAGMRKVQIPVRLFPPLWDRLDELVRDLRDEGLEVDKTAVLNAMLHFHGPADTREAAELVNRWRALLARPPARRD